MKNFIKIRGILIFIAVLILAPFFACLPAGKVLAVNDVQISDNTNFELNTFDTAVLTTIVASSGGQVTNFDVESNYIDITLDNSSNVTFTTEALSQYLKIVKQSGSNDYTISPSCPTTTATLTGTGATVILRLEVLTTNGCPTSPVCGDAICNGGETCSTCPADCGSCGGGGGGGGPAPVNGVCGTSSGLYFYNIPTINLCNAGTASAVAGTGPWTWTCGGLYGGLISPVCTANKALNIPTTPTTPTPTSSGGACGPYMTGYIKLGATNDPTEVKKLQDFLKDYEGFTNLSETGIYDQATYNAVKQFQAKYAQDILTPWGLTAPTGYVYTTTIKEINKIYCQGAQKPTPITIPTTAVPACFAYITKYIQLGAANDSTEVNKLQNFLITYEGDTNLSVTGIYDQATYNAVLQFQIKYGKDILTPWGFTKPTGIVQRTTVAEINKIYCAANAVAPTPLTPAPVTPSCSAYITEPIELGAVNDTAEVNKLQNFMIIYEGFTDVSVTGIYDQPTLNAVKAFQSKYAQDILDPWGLTTPTGYVYTTTIKEINKIYCAAQTTNQ